MYRCQMVRPNGLINRLRWPAAVGLLVLVSTAHAANFLSSGHSFTQSTYLIEIRQDSPLSLKARSMSYGGFETSQGNWVAFDNWYSAKWNDTRLSWITQFNANFGLIWGLSSGEQAEKYSIEPGIRLGLLFQTQTGKNKFLSITGSTMLGGRLKEKTCTADYGEIGGVQEVNCRLAASTLEPSQTLNYLYNEKPESSVQIRYRLSFN